MSYNLTGLSSNSTSLVNYVTGINNVLLFGWLGVLLLIGITAITFMSFMFSTNDVKKSISASAFLAFGFSIFLSALSLIPPLALFICLISAAAAIAITWDR